MCEAARFILPATTQQQLTCSECAGYLNTGPLAIKTTGENVCGKCLGKTTKHEGFIKNSALETVLQSVLFSCKYANLGCVETYPFDDKFQHENTCLFRSYYCPANPAACAWFGRATQLPEHYRECHPELLMENPKFRITLARNSTETRLFLVQGLLFLIRLHKSKEDKKMWVRVDYIGATQHALEIKYKLVLQAGDSSGLQMVIKEQEPQVFTDAKFDVSTAQIIDVNSLLILLENPDFVECNISFTIPNDLIKDLKDKLKAIKCPHCKVYMSAPVLLCPKGHYTCEDCIGYKFHCRGCKVDGVVFKEDVDLERVSAGIQLPCRWRNCKRSFGSLEIRKHEQKCKYKLYKCPLCIDWFGLYDQIYHHFQIEHASQPTHKANETTLEGDLPLYDYYLISFGQVFFCSLSTTPEEDKIVSVRYYGAPSLRDTFNYIVVVKHYEESKTYTLTKCYASEDSYIFSVKIPVEELKEYGNPMDYILSIKILELNDEDSLQQ